MTIVACGVDFFHKTGEFSARACLPHYFISHFRTDYLAEIDGTLVEGRAGDVMILSPGVPVYHGPRPQAAEGFRNDWMFVEGDDVEDWLAQYPLPQNRPFRTAGAHLLSAAIERVEQERLTAVRGYEQMCELIVRMALLELHRATAYDTEESTEERLSFARRAILREHRRAWTLADMASLAGYSVSRFSALYKAQYHTSPVEDLLRHRIEQAKLLLQYGDMPLSEIAETVGFSSIYYFSRLFKKREGVSPSACRRGASMPEARREASQRTESRRKNALG